MIPISELKFTTKITKGTNKTQIVFVFFVLLL
jgi:hypothetical protein